MSPNHCRLCASNPAITHSHVIPSFVYRALKGDSPTGYFRNPHQPNRRVQDGDKAALLCVDCEQRFGDAERQFHGKVFKEFHVNDRADFEYGPWLHYFVTSLAWRTLVLDLPGMEADVRNPRSYVGNLVEAAENMRHYLLGADTLAGSIRTHVAALAQCNFATAGLAEMGPNVMLRRSVFGFAVLDSRYGYSGIVHNLAGFVCFLIVKGRPGDDWIGTKVDPRGGNFVPPQRVRSWLMGELLTCLCESAERNTAMSPNQRATVAAALSQNPTAASLRFRELDKAIKLG